MGHARLTDGLVEQKRLADVLDLGYCAFEVEGFGEHDFKDLYSFDKFWFSRDGRRMEYDRRGRV